MKKFSKEWKGSKKPRKQRKYRTNSQLHIKQCLMQAHLSKELREKYGKRATHLRKGDRVKVMRGGFKNHDGKVEKLDLKKMRAFVNGIEITKKDGTKRLVPIHPSNLMIIEPNLDDKFRQGVLGRK